MNARLRRWMPRSIASRLYLIIFAGLLLAHGMSFGLLFFERYQSAKTVMLNTLEHDVGSSVAILDRLPAGERPAWLGRLQRDTYRYILGPGQAGTELISDRSRVVTGLIQREVGPSFAVKANTVSVGPERYQVHLTLHDGAPLTIEVTPRVMPLADWLPFVFILQMVVLVVITWLAVRLATRPLVRLARAAEKMTPTNEGPRMREDGPTEVARAAVAFNAMQDRIALYVKERLQILAAISHDLQTPITRMRLRAEALDDSTERGKLLDDLHEMEHLVREGVAYARSAHGATETPRKIDPSAFVESLVFDYQDTGKPVSLSGSIDGTAVVRPQALRRVLGNLIDNALKYAGTADVGIARTAAGTLCIDVADRGPGIPEAELVHVLEPFYRLETSRNRDTGGTGLGLAIAAQLMLSVGGRLTLANRPGGGLLARIELP
ncbi:HAMP domain-containing sensor histidine kinase [Luteibacter sp.]|uniref:HAMP domain-containing sensor histidine kinase n=1 Tax=Luteibacter sp. TaxID=1886636 RepID=UPI002D7F3BF0|nr:HAMP domain-containing sensor histidine kinase [Luteibacter sp.]